MYTLSQIAPIFANLDEGHGADVSTVDKGLRNLTQRFPIAPTSKDGRAFVYDRGGVVAVRLCFLAHQFGLNRVLLHPYARFLSQVGCEAVTRAERGERFTFFVVARPVGADVWASWEAPAESADLSRAETAIWLQRNTGMELGRFTQDSDLVRQVLSAIQYGQA